MEATVSPRPAKRGLIRRKADYIPPSRYTLRAAASDGDALTRLSFLILGAGNLARKQIVKGLLFLAVEIAYIVYMATAGVGSLGTLASLGSRTQTRQKIDGYWYYDAGDNSVLLLTAGVATVFITVLFVVFWSYAVRSAYKAQVLQRETGAAPTLLDDWRKPDRPQRAGLDDVPAGGGHPGVHRAADAHHDLHRVHQLRLRSCAAVRLGGLQELRFAVRRDPAR